MINGTGPEKEHDDDEADRIAHLTSRIATAGMQRAKTRARDGGNDRHGKEIEHLTEIVDMQRDLLIEMRRVIAESELIAPHLWGATFLAADLLNTEIDLSTGSEGDLGALREKRAAITRQLAGEIVALRTRMEVFGQRLEPDGQAVKPGEPGSKLRAALNMGPASKS
jgi:hypothetical protein